MNPSQYALIPPEEPAERGDDIESKGSTMGKEAEKRKNKFEERFGRHGDKKSTFCQEHWLRCPPRKPGEAKLANLYSFTLQGWFQGLLTILVMIWIFTVYDIVA